ncbi:hypothetical protein Q1695_013541 [Nippostrongylus brasiliensis]|nr:hypothetical protein Q1695_013541 [Nippostrongylus brasiliensis]
MDDNDITYHRQTKKKSKNSGNSAYYEWFLKEGKQWFRRQYGREYNPDVDDDRHLISMKWREVKDRWDRDMKIRKGKLKGPFKQLRPDEIEYEGPSRAFIPPEDCRPPNFPLPVEHCDSYQQRTHPRKINGQRDMLILLNFLEQEKIPLSSKVLQFVSVYPYTVALSTVDDLLVYPAEISMVHLTLENGLSSRFSKHIKFLPKQFYGSGIPEWDQQNVATNARELDVPLKDPHGVSPSEAWRLMSERFSRTAITVCDADELVLVDSALYFLASTAGSEALAIHQEIMSSIVSVQDLLKALVNHTVNDKNTNVKLTHERIDQEFKGLRETAHCCRYHAKRPSIAHCRQLCPEARIITLIDILYNLCLSDNLANFRDLYDQDVHAVTTIDVDPLEEQDDDAPGSTTADKEEVVVSPARESTTSRGFKLHYEVVREPKNDMKKSPKTVVNLKDAISEMLRQLPSSNIQS